MTEDNTEGSRPGRPVPQGRVRRTAPLVGLAGRNAGEAIVATLRTKFRGGDSAQFHTRAAERYVERLGRSKGVLMKAGQILSFVTVNGAVPEEYQPIYQAALSRLQDEAPPMPAEVAAAVVEAELGMPPAKAFAEFTPIPLAAASIGQVHAARTYDGREVVVKVQYPGVEEAIRADLGNTELLATFFALLQKVGPDFARVDARALAREVAARIGEEIDYHREAANQAAFADAYRGHPFIRIPEVVPELSTRRVLTMEHARGLRWAAALEADGALRDRWGEVIFRFALGSLRRLQMFNADPHPGNYLFHPDGGVTFLDFGCVKRFEPEHLATQLGIVSAMLDGDADALGPLLERSGFLDPAHAPDRDLLYEWFRESLRPILAPQPFTYTPEFAAEVVQHEFSPFGRFSEITRKLAMQPDYVLLSRIDMGMTAVLGALGATGHWAGIIAEWDRGGPPAGEFGEADSAFWADRNER